MGGIRQNGLGTEVGNPIPEQVALTGPLQEPFPLAFLKLITLVSGSEDGTIRLWGVLP